MAYNNEAKRLFEKYNLTLPKLIKHYHRNLDDDSICRMLDDMENSDDKRQLVRVLDCDDCYSVADDKYGHTRYAIPMTYFMKSGVVNEKFVLSMAKGTFRKYKGRNGECVVTTATSRYELLTKVIMVLGRD